MYKRKLESIIIALLDEFRLLYLTGPRQSGKTTLARSIAQNKDMIYLSFDNQTILEAARTDPIGFLQTLEHQKAVLDEFQYIPELVPAIKSISDSLTPEEKGKFILTGSTDIFRSAKTQEALPGHIARLELYPLSLSEKLNSTQNIVDYLCTGDFKNEKISLVSRQAFASFIIQGGYPEIQDKSPRAKQIWYKSYIEGRLYKDFESLYAIKGDYHSKLQALISYLAGLSGNLIKYANISNDLQQDDKTIKSYIKILELMFIVTRVPAYIKNRAKRIAITMPKLQMIDTGLACYLLGIKNEEQLIQSYHFGGLLENFLYMELLKQSTWANNDVILFHFRDNKKNEVDIVMEQDDHTIIGIEIKSSATVRQEDFKGLIKLAEYSGKYFQYGVLFYSGNEVLSFTQDNIKLFALPIALLVN